MTFTEKKNSIISFVLLVSTILMPLSFIPKKAEAQSAGGYVSGLGGAILKLPQCNIVGGTMSTIKGLFSSSSSLGGTENPISLEGNEIDINGTIGKLGDAAKLDDIANSAANSFDSVQVSDPNSTKLLQKIDSTTTATQKATESLNENSTCIQSIGRLIIKMLLQKLTMSTVNWINSGFNGSPAFIQDPSKFFKDIAKNEVLQFGAEINDPALFPFGKTWLKNTATAFNNKFQDNAKYSLDKMIQDTNPESSALVFGQDFSQGGWNAWTAMTQSPANNPLGFKLMADNELQSRLAGTTQSTADYVHEALSQANGFLGDERCVDPEGITKQQDYNARVAGQKNFLGEVIGVCKEWQYVTPGKMVADAATNVVGYQNNAYLNVTDLNDAVAAVLDALLGQFSSNIMEKGFANIGDTGSDGKLVFVESGVTDTRTQTQKDFMPSQLSSSWLAANPDFNIRTDLTQALIDEQRTYSDKLALQNKELMSTTDGKKYTLSSDGKSSNAYGLMPTIYQLDFCIPGPHPGYEEDSRRTLSAVENIIIPETPETLDNVENAAIMGAIKTFGPLAGAAIGASIGSAVPVVGTIIGAAVGALVGFLVDTFSSTDKNEKARMYYSGQIQALTGYLPNYTRDSDDRTGNITSKQGMTQVVDTILNRYIAIMNKTYFSSTDMLPSVAKEAAVNFRQLAGYAQMIKDNETKIATLKSTISILGEIKDAVTTLNKDYPNGGEEYESKLSTQINTFGRLSASMVNGADIASADSLLKQIIDKKDYIYKNLLKGPYGCEADLMKPQKTFPSAGPSTKEGDWTGISPISVKRMTYPFPVLYDYNSIKKGDPIPDPLNSKFINNMPIDSNKDVYDSNGNNKYGPGFLGFILFSTEGPSNNKDLRRGDERLKIHDLVPQDENAGSRYRAIGNRNTEGEATGGPFETVIGVY